ncbi:DegT/DnrJ/EryC1/StrS family aminotransferase [Paucibacter sp. R3-3]|uniref:DegT/DnrJ/EryC1/StrS family aminotransferase n=1 Tax=Roseateles agri TaxID=3098619 RepID=A0ABU5DEQ7_9BURK|nr:DegT/DnrJ/EryC1/StrS family aminotransferase [Paucibacter sp. R3-3]MDY0744286.1 DegT/DnrJ/EryC1/StrS family aminotransferase [Paucibacter sp. R3-3]
MKGHIVSALRWRDLPAALLHCLQRGVEGSRDDFRRAFARSLGVDADQVQLFGSGRAALHAFTASLKLPAGAEVLLPGYTCVVVPNVFMHLGLSVRYVDIEPGGFNPSAEAWSAAIAPATRLVVVPHNFGLVTEGLAALRRRHPGVVFVEDCAHAWGSADATGRLAGTLGDAAFFSFEYSKPLSCGIGGALVGPLAQVPELHTASNAAMLRQGLTLAWHRLTMSLPHAALQALVAVLRAPSRALGLVAKTPDSEVAGDSWPDYALALHPLGAALGWRQARRAVSLHALRVAQAAELDALLADAPTWRRPGRAAGTVLLRYPVLLPDAASRDTALRALEAAGIVGGTWFDDVVHPRGSFRFGYNAGDCPIGELAARTVLNLPLGLHARLDAAQREAVRRIAGGDGR